MRTSQRGIDLIKQHEGLRLNTYLDAAGKATIGYGHLLRRGEQFPSGITECHAERLLRDDLKEAEQAVTDLVTTELKQPQFDALVSFVFNLGRGNFASSSLLNEVNAGNHAYVPRELTRWIHAGGRPLLGLARRRVDEADLYLEYF